MVLSLFVKSPWVSTHKLPSDFGKKHKFADVSVGREYRANDYAYTDIVALNLHYIAKSIGSPPSNKRFDYFSNFHEYKS